MGKSYNSITVVQIRRKFEWVIAMPWVKYNHDIFFSKKLDSGGQEGVSQVVGLGFKMCQKGPPKTPFFGAVWVARMSIDKAICIRTNLDDGQIPWGTLLCAANSRNYLFWQPKNLQNQP